MPVQVTARDLWYFLTLGGKDGTYDEFVADEDEDDKTIDMSRETFDAIKAADLKEIIADQWISENRWGGEEVTSLATDVNCAVGGGYLIATWYGGGAEVLVVGYRMDQLEVDCNCD